MGYVSLREDTIERFTSEKSSINLSSITKEMPETDRYDSDRRMQLLVGTMDGLLRKIERKFEEYLELATHPGFDLSHELIEERKRRKYLEEKVNVLQQQLLSHIRQAKSLETKAVPTEKPEAEKLSLSKRRQSKPALLRVCEICQVQVKESKYENHKKKAHRGTTRMKTPLTPIRVIKEPSTEAKQFNGIRM